MLTRLTQPRICEAPAHDIGQSGLPRTYTVYRIQEKEEDVWITSKSEESKWISESMRDYLQELGIAL